MPPLLLALALAAAGDAAAPTAVGPAASTPVDAAALTPRDAAAPAAVDATARTSPTTGAIPSLPAGAPHQDHHGWRHGLGFGPHSTTFSSKEGSQYTFHSASLGYHGSVGARGPFLNAYALFPLQARQDGDVYSTGDYYHRRSGADLLLGWQWRFTVRGDLEAEAGPGLHGTFIYLPGKPGYRDFTALPLGLGAGGILWWRTDKQRLSRTVTVGTYASAAYDFYDPAHAHDLEHGFTFRAGIAAGLGGRR